MGSKASLPFSPPRATHGSPLAAAVTLWGLPSLRRRSLLSATSLMGASFPSPHHPSLHHPRIPSQSLLLVMATSAVHALPWRPLSPRWAGGRAAALLAPPLPALGQWRGGALAVGGADVEEVG